MNLLKLNDYIQQCNLNTNHAGIFVDFDNIYYGLKEYGADPKHPDFCVFSLMEQIYSFRKIRTMCAYADYDQVKIPLKHLYAKRVQIKPVYGNGSEEEFRKNASDIELSIDALELSYHHPDIDTFIFVTSDSDMIPIMNRLMYHGKQIHLFYLEPNTSHYQNISHFSHLSCDLISLFEIDPDRKQPEYWKEKALSEIRTWYSSRKNHDMMLGGRWLNHLLCDKLMISPKAASNLITYLEQNHLICDSTSPAGYSGFIIPHKNNNTCLSTF